MRELAEKRRNVYNRNSSNGDIQVMTLSGGDSRLIGCEREL
jgi:hypothetical protein